MTLSEIPILIILPPVRRDPDPRLIFVQTAGEHYMGAGRVQERISLRQCIDRVQRDFRGRVGMALRELEFVQRCRANPIDYTAVAYKPSDFGL
jgi:hypothetical protein